MRARTFACLAPLAFAWASGCSRGALGPGEAAVDAQLSDAARADVVIDAGPPTDGHVVIDAPMSDTAPVDSSAPPPLTGWRSFVVTSSITVDADGGAQPTSVPSSQTFTIALDAERGTAIVGWAGSVTSLPADVSGTSVRVHGSFGISTSGCPGEGATYENAAFAVGSGGQLTGSSTGRVTWLVGGDMAYTAAASMSLTGVSDTQAPVLTVFSSPADITDPFTSFYLAASEPLPPDARPKLIGGGDEIVFVPAAAEEFAGLFVKTPTLLHYDTQYRVALDGVVDFAGNAAAASTIQFTTRAAPPLVSEDGFESATGATLGGAQVLSGTDAPVIAGARSLYVPVDGNPFPLRQTQLALRLALAPGDTVVRFAYRLVNPTGIIAPYFAFARPGGGRSILRMSSPASTTPGTIPGQGQVALGPLTTAEIPLPAGVGSELVIARIVSAGACPGPPGSPLEGIIIDDLRVE